MAFEVRGRPVTYLEVVQAAEVGGALEPFVRHSAALVRAEAAAVVSGAEADMDAVESMIEAFRYDRDLVTVEETEAWLARHRLVVDDLTAHFLRRHWHQVLGDEADASAGTLPGDTTPPWHVDLVLEGTLERWARRQAHADGCLLDRPAPEPASVQAWVAALRQARNLDDAGFSRWKEDWGLDDALLTRFLRGSSEYLAARNLALSDDAKARLLREQRGALLRVELEVAEFDTESAAREAYLCVTADRLPLATVAEDSGFLVERREDFLRDVPEAWRGGLLGLPAGGVLPPLPTDGRHCVVRLVDRRDPALSDPEVLAEVEQQLLSQRFGELEANEIRWRMGGAL